MSETESPPRPTLPLFYGNDTRASTTWAALVLPYPTPLSHAAHAVRRFDGCDVGYADRNRITTYFLGGQLDRSRRDDAPVVVDRYATAIRDAVTRWRASPPRYWTSQRVSRGIVDKMTPFSYTWCSMCDTLDYISASPYFECYMAHVLRFVVHFNRAAEARLESAARWERDVQPCADASTARTQLDAWRRHDEDARQLMSAEWAHCVDAAAVCKRTLHEWSTWRTASGVRYPPEMSHAFAQRFDELVRVWAHNTSLETSVGGVVVARDDGRAETWLEAVRVVAPRRLADMYVWQRAHTRALQRVLYDHEQLRAHAELLDEVACWSDVAALYEFGLTLLDQFQYRRAAQCAQCLRERCPGVSWTARENVVARSLVDELARRGTVRSGDDASTPPPASAAPARLDMARTIGVTGRYFRDTA